MHVKFTRGGGGEQREALTQTVGEVRKCEAVLSVSEYTKHAIVTSNYLSALFLVNIIIYMSCWTEPLCGNDHGDDDGERKNKNLFKIIIIEKESVRISSCWWWWYTFYTCLDSSHSLLLSFCQTKHKKLIAIITSLLWK